MISENNYINIQGWMISELGLKGNELIIFAIIYGFSQDGKTKFQGSLQYLADWTNSTKQGVIKSLKRLVERGYINKVESEKNGVKKVEYYSTKFNGGIKQSLMGGIKQSLTNNIDINNINNKEKKIKRKKEVNLNHYGEFGNVCLTEQDYIRLGKENTLFLDAIEKLDGWLDTKNGEKNKNRNHRAYFKSNSWVWENLKPKQNNQTGFLDEMREKRNRELGL